MRRIFGARKAKAPAPSLGDASQRLDERTTALDEKIRKLDIELAGYKEKLKKARGELELYTDSLYSLFADHAPCASAKESRARQGHCSF